VGEDTELPLPDEELPKCVQQGMDVMKAVRFLVADESTERNEWEELSESIEALCDSLASGHGIEEHPEEFVNEEVEGKLGHELFLVLCEHVEREEVESSRDFLEIVADDPDSVQDVQQIFSLERIISQSDDWDSLLV
jgi:TusA-related sulfurtransferase